MFRKYIRLQRIKRLVSRVRLVVFDFDGVFTDNRVYVSQLGDEFVSCSRSDGLGLRKLDRIKVKYYIVSTETNPVVSMRAKKLRIPVTQGHNDKLPVLKKIVLDMGFNMGDVAYVGNDINDLGCMNVVGLPISVRDAYPEVVKKSKYQTSALGGYGAVREVCDLIYKLNKRGSK